jgi:hypothetical protein
MLKVLAGLLVLFKLLQITGQVEDGWQVAFIDAQSLLVALDSRLILAFLI